jgi:hypothetical protein
MGKIVVATVKLNEDASASEQGLITHCKTWL